MDESWTISGNHVPPEFHKGDQVIVSTSEDVECIQATKHLTRWAQQRTTTEATEQWTSKEESCVREDDQSSAHSSYEEAHHRLAASSQKGDIADKHESGEYGWNETRQSQATTLGGRASDFFQRTISSQEIIEEVSSNVGADFSSSNVEDLERSRPESGEACSLGAACAICSPSTRNNGGIEFSSTVSNKCIEHVNEDLEYVNTDRCTDVVATVKDEDTTVSHRNFFDCDAEENRECIVSKSESNTSVNGFGAVFVGVSRNNSEDAILRDSEAGTGGGGGVGGGGGGGGGVLIGSGCGDYYGDEGRKQKTNSTSDEKTRVRLYYKGSCEHSTEAEESAWDLNRKRGEAFMFGARWREESRSIIRQVMREKSFSDIANALALINIIAAGSVFIGVFLTLTCRTSYVSELLAWAVVMFIAALLATIPLQVAAMTSKEQHGDLYCSAEQRYDAGMVWFCRVQLVVIGIFDLVGIILILIVFLNLGHLRPFIAGMILLFVILLTVLIPLEMQRRYLYAHHRKQSTWKSIKYRIRHHWKQKKGVFLQVVLYLVLMVLVALLSLIPYDAKKWPANQCPPIRQTSCCTTIDPPPADQLTNKTTITTTTTAPPLISTIKTTITTTTTIPNTPLVPPTPPACPSIIVVSACGCQSMNTHVSESTAQTVTVTNCLPEHTPNKPTPETPTHPRNHVSSTTHSSNSTPSSSTTSTSKPTTATPKKNTIETTTVPQPVTTTEEVTTSEPCTDDEVRTTSTSTTPPPYYQMYPGPVVESSEPCTDSTTAY